MLGREDLRKQVVAVRVIRASKVEVAALEPADLLVEKQVVHGREPLELFVGGDAGHRYVAVALEERDVLGGRDELEPDGRKRRKLVGHAGSADFGLGFGKVSRMCVRPTGW